MTSVFKCLIIRCVPLLLTASINAVPQGVLEGHLSIVSPREVGASDDMPRQIVAPETYAKYPLIILSQDGNKEVARLTADEDGNYRVALPPGAYVLDVQDRAAKRLRARPQPFTVVSNQSVRVDMNVNTGIR